MKFQKFQPTAWLQASIGAFQRILSGKRRILSDGKNTMIRAFFWLVVEPTPLKNIKSNWESSPDRDENTKYWKPPTGLLTWQNLRSLFAQVKLLVSPWNLKKKQHVFHGSLVQQPISQVKVWNHPTETTMYKWI